MNVVTVQYATTEGTAKAGADYQTTSGTLSFQPGQTAQMIMVPILSDQESEDFEAFTLGLSNPTNATLGTIAQATLTIRDDDFRLDNQAAPRELAATQDGNVWFTDPTNNRIGRVLSSGSSTKRFFMVQW